MLLFILYHLHTKYLQSDWSIRVQYWSYSPLDPNIVFFNKKTTTFEFQGAKT